MPIRIEALSGGGVLLCQHTGKIEDQELVRRYSSVFIENPEYSRLDLLVDLRASDSSPRTAHSIRSVARSPEIMPEDATNRRVVIIAENDLSFGLARMFSHMPQQ